MAFVVIVTGEVFEKAYDAAMAVGGFYSSHCVHCGGGYECGPHCYYPRSYALVGGGPREQIAKDGFYCRDKDLPADVLELATATTKEEVLKILRAKAWWSEQELGE